MFKNNEWLWDAYIRLSESKVVFRIARSTEFSECMVVERLHQSGQSGPMDGAVSEKKLDNELVR